LRGGKWGRGISINAYHKNQRKRRKLCGERKGKKPIRQKQPGRNSRRVERAEHTVLGEKTCTLQVETNPTEKGTGLKTKMDLGPTVRSAGIGGCGKSLGQKRTSMEVT